MLDDLRAHAREEAPRECCGLLVGTKRAVVRSLRARNLSASATRYLVDPEDHFAALRAARAEDLAVVGAYHSHPASPPEPSETDLAEATYPHFLYVIVSLADRTREEVRAYRLGDGCFRAVEIEPAP